MTTDAMKKPGAFSWNELLTTDVAGAKAFYSELFGWKLQDISPGGTAYTLVKVEEQEVGGMMAVPAEEQGMPPAWGAYVTVSNVDAMIGQVEKLGGRVCMPPRDIPNVGRFMIIQDPQGAMLSLISYS